MNAFTANARNYVKHIPTRTFLEVKTKLLARHY